MITPLIFTLVSNLQASTLDAELAKMLGQNSSAWVAVNARSLMTTVVPSFRSLLLKTGQLSSGKLIDHGFFVYNSSWLFPVAINGGGPGDGQYLKELYSLIKPLTVQSVQSSGEWRMIMVNRSSVDSRLWDSLIGAWPVQSPWAKSRLTSEKDTRINLRVQPRLMIYNDADQLVEELNVARFPHAQRTLVPALQAMKLDVPPRCPDELKRAIKPSSFQIDKGDSFQTVRQIVGALANQCQISLTVDDRVGDLIVVTKSKGQQVHYSVLAQLIAEVLNLYWRKVGDRYHLTVSAGDPRRDVQQPEIENFDSLLVDVLTKLQELGLIDPTIPAFRLAGAHLDLGRASDQTINAII